MVALKKNPVILDAICFHALDLWRKRFNNSIHDDIESVGMKMALELTHESRSIYRVQLRTECKQKTLDSVKAETAVFLLAVMQCSSKAFVFGSSNEKKYCLMCGVAILSTSWRYEMLERCMARYTFTSRGFSKPAI